MSDQGEGADRWRPATKRTDDGSTTPIPKTDDDSTGFPPANDGHTPSNLPAWALDDDTGEFPPATDADEDRESLPPMRDPFEPLDRSFGGTSPTTDSSENTSFGETPSFEGSRGEASTFGKTSFDASFGSVESSFEKPSFDAPSAYEAEPKEPFPPLSKAPARSADEPESEEQAAENEFFAPDDNPAMWDRRVAPAGPPPQPGKPSSGNLRLPDWMREEGPGERPPAGPSHDDGFEEKRSRLPLFAGIGLLMVGLLVAGGVFFLKTGGDSPKEPAGAPKRAHHPKSPGKPDDDQGQDRPLPQFKGRHTKAAGRVLDQRAGLSYAKLAKPWQPAARKSPMTEIGFSQSQFAVTEKAGAKPTWWGRLMSAELGGAAKGVYKGPGTERKTTMQVADQYEARLYGFRHKKRLMASQSLEADGHRGWLVTYNVTFRRPGVRATGDLMAVAIVDTGRKSPGVVVMTVPNTAKKLWPDVNYVMRTLKVA